MRRESVAGTAMPVVLAASLMMVSATARADDADPPMMDAAGIVMCMADESGARWRVQCNDATRRCLYAPDTELDIDGKPAKPLERARPCAHSIEPFDPERLRAQGFEPVRGLPDAPYGWTRDERGRVFQVVFDLKRRLYLGVRYAPRWRSAASETGRLGIDFGLLSFEHTIDRTRHRVRLVEGETLLAPFSSRLVLAHYDISRRYLTPLMRISTFFGKPRRYDLMLNVGAWLEAGDIEIFDTPAGDEQLTKYATLHGTIDLWQSADLYSYVRLRGGVGFESAEADGDPLRRLAITPGGALDADFTLDRSGFHHIDMTLSYERPQYYERHPRLGAVSRRMQARLAYEVIVLAVNDQPISLYLGIGAEKRDDIESLPDTWAATADTGLRFSLWAPPRVPSQ